MYGNKCFEKSMDNITIEGSCDCPMECNSISYSFSVVTTPFDPELLCRDDVNDYNFGKSDFLMKPFYKRKDPPQYERRLLKMMNNVSEEAMTYCKKNLKYRAEVIFKMATDSMSVTTMSRRLSLFDKMSAFGKYFLQLTMLCYFYVTGGTLGLFTGISILSMIEATFWIVRYLVKNSTMITKGKTCTMP